MWTHTVCEHIDVAMAICSVCTDFRDWLIALLQPCKSLTTANQNFKHVKNSAQRLTDVHERRWINQSSENFLRLMSKDVLGNPWSRNTKVGRSKAVNDNFWSQNNEYNSLNKTDWWYLTQLRLDCSRLWMFNYSYTVDEPNWKFPPAVLMLISFGCSTVGLANMIYWWCLVKKHLHWFPSGTSCFMFVKQLCVNIISSASFLTCLLL